MKELTIEQKAKAYDEAIKVIKDNLDALNEITETGAEVVNIQSIKNCFYRAFPELKESENEKVKNKLIEFFKGYSPDEKWWGNITQEDILAWLEKQRDKDKLIQELGEYKVKYTQEVLEKHINNMNNKDDERLRKTTIAFLKDFAEQGYENAVECIDWLEKQGKINEDLIAKKFLINKGYPIDANGTFPTYEELYNIIREGLENQCEQKHAKWSEEDKKVINIVISNYDSGYLPPLAQGQEIINLLKSLKDRVQPKQEWSDEDEYMLNETIQHLKELIEIDKAHHFGCDVQFYQRDIDWLESIKNRVQTKQEWSEMDENIISEVIQNYESGFLPSVIERDRIVKALKSLKQKK